MESNYIPMKLFGSTEIDVYESPYSDKVITTLNITDKFQVDVSGIYWTINETPLYKMRTSDGVNGYIKTYHIKQI